MDKRFLLCVVLFGPLTLVRGQQGAPPPCSQLLSRTDNTHQAGEWRSKLNLPVTRPVARWQATIRFSRPVAEFSNSKAQHSTSDMRVFVLRAHPTRVSLVTNTTLQLDFEVKYSGSPSTLFIESVHFDGSLVCNVSDFSTGQRIQTSTPPATSSSANRRLKYDYGSAIYHSLLFYEAQRSGLLPTDNRISWRNDSCVDDRGARNEDLSGGYYTNGRTIKFTFPTAAAMTILAWGIITHDEGYKRANQLDLAKDAVYWGTSYFERCHTSQDELYALVGDVVKENQEWWGRPEDINFYRPAYSVTPSNPGSELAAETAAALAASSILFEDSAIRQRQLNHAKQLFNFANNYRGDYSKAVPQAAESYRSWSGDEDELAWAALWLYRATGQESYLEVAKNMYKSFKLGDRKITELSWDEKTLAVRTLLASYTLDEKYAKDAEKVCDTMVLNTTLRTPQGLFHIGQPVGAIRYASNMAFACFELGEVLMANRGLATNPYLDFAVRQVNLILGESGRSFMVGVGKNPPQRVQHSAASCPNMPIECGWKNKNDPGPNPQILYGALVGGPDMDGRYEDSRNNWNQNDVGVDYNAGFQSLLAAFVNLHQQGKLPDSAYETKSNNQNNYYG